MSPNISQLHANILIYTFTSQNPTEAMTNFRSNAQNPICYYSCVKVKTQEISLALTSLEQTWEKRGLKRLGTKILTHMPHKYCKP